jgi:outer membrane immunogenic protein
MRFSLKPLKTGAGALTALAFAIGAAQAADLPPPPAAAPIPPRPVIQAPPPPAPVHNWTGLYLGLHGGWGWDKADMTVETTNFWGNAGGESTTLKDNGFLGGGQIGFLHQPTSSFVWGVDLSGSWVDLEKTGASPVPLFATDDIWTAGIDYIVMAQLRLGWAMDNWLLFIQGGYAGADGNAEAEVIGLGCCFTAKDSEWHHGWTVGGGVLVKLYNLFSIGAEYNYVDLGSKKYSLASGFGPPGDTFKVDHRTHIVKITGNIHFGGLP